jgi:predicted  nucleic acid-binding Zn-ribbon protein
MSHRCRACGQVRTAEDELARLREENEKLNADHTESEKALIDTVNAQADRIAKLEEALRFYAENPTTVVSGSMERVVVDRGERARQALEMGGGKPCG